MQISIGVHLREQHTYKAAKVATAVQIGWASEPLLLDYILYLLI